MPKKNKKEGVFEKTDEFIDESDEFLEDYEKPESEISKETSVDVGEEEADVYTESGRDVLEESDEIEPWEEGFSEGAAQRGTSGTCAHCKAVLSDDENENVERIYRGRKYRFCSDECAEAGPEL